MKLYPLITQEQIIDRIHQLSIQIKCDFKEKDLLIIMVFKGALCFVADLIRKLDIQLDIEAVQCSSYGNRGNLRGALEVIGAERIKVENRDILLVDDIFDSGHTMMTLIDLFTKKKPRSLKTCVLLYKKDVEKVTEYRPDYILFDIPNKFVVGYGLDFKEHYRGLNGIYILEFS